MEGRDTVLEGGTPSRSRNTLEGTVAHGGPMPEQGHPWMDYGPWRTHCEAEEQ